MFAFPRKQSRSFRALLVAMIIFSSWGSRAYAVRAADSSSPPSVTPPYISATIDPGQTYTAHVDVFTGSNPINKGDVFFVFDRTSSMREEIGQVKESAIQIMDNVVSEVPSAWFGVGSFADYSGYYSYPGYGASYGAVGDTPWELNKQLTADTVGVASAISALSLGNGEDVPENYTRALYEVMNLTWRPRTKKIAILFGDAPTHDLSFAGYNYGGDPGRDGIANTADDLDFETTVQQLHDNGVAVVAIDSSVGRKDAEATLRGMSTGNLGAVGTMGQYFKIQNASDIPNAVTQLIKTETQQIDKLELQITDEYASWVVANPPSYADVASNITKTFDISITPPPDTPTGFYSFLISVLADGVVLDAISVDITIPSSNQISDLGFRPNPDGFQFENFKSTQTWDMFRQFFGTSVVEFPNGNRVKAADEFYNKYYHNAGSKGSCDGFSAASLLNFTGLSQPNAGQFALSPYSPLYDQKRNADMSDALAYYQGVQVGLESAAHSQRLCTQLKKSPSGFYRYLKSLMQNNSPAVVGIRWDKDYYAYFPRQKVLEPGAHALVPYRFEETADDKAYVYVYDSNLPGNDKHRIEFDLKNDTWSYRWPIPLWPDITIQGDARACNISVTPLEIYRHKGSPWWVIPPDPGPVDPIPQIFAATGAARLLFTDDEGHRFGWSNNDFFDEIPGAYYTAVSQSVNGDMRGLYFVPSNLVYTLALEAHDNGVGSISMLGQRHLVQIEAPALEQGNIISLDVSPAGEGLALSSVISPTHVSLLLSDILAEQNQDHTVQVSNLTLRPAETTSLKLATDDATGLTSINLSTDSIATSTYGLSLMRGGGDGYVVFGHAEIPIEANSSTSITVQSWSSLDTITAQIDIGRDATIDATSSFVNESVPASLRIEASRPVAVFNQVVTITVGLLDQFGTYAADGAPITLETTLGQFSQSSGMTAGGLATFALETGSTAGIALITARSGTLERTIEVPIQSPDAPVTVHVPSLRNLLIRNAAWQAQNEFMPGEVIRLGMNGTVQGDAVPVKLWWKVSDGSGNPVPELSFDGFEATIGPGFWGYDYSPTIPATLSSGQYTYRGELSYAGEIQQLETTFTIVRPPSNNLLVNGDFEQDNNNDGGPDGWSADKRFTRSSDIVHGGGYAGKLFASNKANFRVWQWMPTVASGAGYDLSGYVNIPAASAGFELQLQVSWWSDTTGTNLISTIPIKRYTGSTNGGWELVRSSLVAPIGAQSATVRLIVKNLGGSVYVDDFSFRAQ